MGRVGGKLGCLAALVVAAILTFPLLFLLAWSGAHCDPVPQCQRDGELLFAAMMAGVLALAGITGFLVRGAVNALAAMRSDEGSGAVFLLAATAGTLLVAWMVASGAVEILDRI